MILKSFPILVTLLQAMIKLGMGTEPGTSEADLTEKNPVKAQKEQPGVD